MGMVRLQDIWGNKLVAEGWPEDCVIKYPLFLAPSTLEHYNRCLHKFYVFCQENGHVFPPQECDVLVIIVGFLNLEAQKSKRPESMLKSLVSALKHLLRALSVKVEFDIIDNFVKSLINVHTSEPKGRTKVLPIQVFPALFRSWGPNEKLSLSKLRQKAITLFALAAMTRPSDIAPHIGFKRKQLKFTQEGNLIVQFFGVKNDSQKTGFEIIIKGASDDLIDPVRCLHEYLDRTQRFVCDDNGPVFISLRRPHNQLSAPAVSDILNSVIREAGLGDSGFSARSFRPTGATAYIQSGVEPHVTRSLGRWRSEQCFSERYVYPLSSVSATDKMLNVSLPT